MHLVQQITPFTCGLACIESFTTDASKPITQTELLVRYKALLLQVVSPEIGHFGAANNPVLAVILQDLGYKVFFGKDHRKDLMREEFKKQAGVLICANYNLQAGHCWLLEKVVDDDYITALNPNFFLPAAQIDKLSFDDLIKWDYSFIMVSK